MAWGRFAADAAVASVLSGANSADSQQFGACCSDVVVPWIVAVSLRDGQRRGFGVVYVCFARGSFLSPQV